MSGLECEAGKQRSVEGIIIQMYNNRIPPAQHADESIEIEIGNEFSSYKDLQLFLK